MGLELCFVKVVDVNILPFKAGNGLGKFDIVAPCCRRYVGCLIDAGFELQRGVFYPRSRNERSGGVIGHVNNRMVRLFGAVVLLGSVIIGAGFVPSQ